MGEKRLYDIMFESVKDKKFKFADDKKPEDIYRIKGIFYDTREKDPIKKWYLDCENLTKQKKEKLGLSTIRDLVEI